MPAPATKTSAPPRSRWLLRFALTLVGTYVALVVIMMFFENALVYHATPAEVYWLRPPSPDVRDVILKTTEGEEIHSWWLPCPASPGALLYLHGNAGNLSQRGDTVLNLRDALGLSVLIIDYPGFGKSPGVPTEAGCYRAADAAYDWLTLEHKIIGRQDKPPDDWQSRTLEQKIAPEQIVLFGKSLGGGVATHLASRKDHRALVLVKTFTTLPDVAASIYPWLPVRLLMRNRFDSLSRIGDCHRPMFVAHGTTDELIPFALGQRLYEAANAPKEFLALEGHGHNDAFPPQFYTGLKEFLRQHPSPGRDGR